MSAKDETGQGDLNRRNVLLAGTTLAVASAVAVSGTLNVAQAQQPAQAQQQKPNVVFILAEGTLGGAPREVKPLALEVRANIDSELADKSIDFMRPWFTSI